MIKCHFFSSGFPFLAGSQARLCHSWYHPQCFRAGYPFTTRRGQETGLGLPPKGVWDPFICEACTVRSMCDRELHGRQDWRLLCLERMRIIDMANYWSQGSIKTYASKIIAITRFERIFGIQILPSVTLRRPPTGQSIAIMWVQEFHSLRKRPTTRDPHSESHVSFGTVRQIRSAAAHRLTWQQIITDPDHSFLDTRRKLIKTPVRQTDSTSNTLFAAGLAARLGTETRPSIALLARHVRALDSSLDYRYQTATTLELQRLYARAGLANLQFFLGWFRPSELFDSRWNRYEVTEPQDGPNHDLPVGIGVIRLIMGPETKSDRTFSPDVIMAYTTISGFQIGRWFHRLRNAVDPYLNYRHDYRQVFVHENSTPWDSRYFRQTFLYPSLLQQAEEGDAYLRPHRLVIPEKFWSLNCYRRGARSHVSHTRHRSYAIASKSQIYEHGRWRLKRSSEDIDKVYQQWPISERLKITLYSM
jgi:hypothetical protein